MSEARHWLQRITGLFQRMPTSRVELLGLLHELKHVGVLDAESLAMIEGVLQVFELTVAQIMIPRAQMVSVDVAQQPEEFVRYIWQSGHSRFPVFDEKKEQVAGIVLAKDLLNLLLDNAISKPFNFGEYVRPVMVVPETKRLDSLLQEFKRDHQHMAIAVDEYGSVAGLVTIEDVLEQIVGSIDDEYDMDEEQHYVVQQPNGTTVVKAMMPLEAFNEHFGVEYPATDACNTIGGYLLSRWHRMPRRNETIQCGALHFTVLHVDHRRLHLLSVQR